MYPVGGLRVLSVIFLAHPRLKQLGDTPRDCIAWGIGNRQSMDSYLCRITDLVSMVEKPSQEPGPPESAREKFAFVLPDLGSSWQDT